MFGFSIYCGLAIPNWVNKNPEKLQTGECCLVRTVTTPGVKQGGPWSLRTVTLVAFQGFSSWIRSSKCS